MKKIILSLSVCFFSVCSVFLIAEENIKLDKAPVDITDLPSLQRGAKLFMNYCSGCHSLKYIRYNTLAKGIGIVDSTGKILDQVIKDNLLFVGEKVSDPILTAMKKEQADRWFGIAAPDLTLVTRLRSPDWVYTYLRSFYHDPKRPWGVNNKIFPEVAMPDVLYTLRKTLTPEEFNGRVADLVNFLTYVGDPIQLERKQLGVWVLVFLGILLVFAWLLKREYWKDVH